MEWLDVVSAEGEILGKATRKQCHEQRLRHRMIQIVLAHGGKLLFQQRSKSKDVYPFLWEVGVSGHVRSGEQAASAAARELFEELGIRPRLQEKGCFELSTPKELAIVHVYYGSCPQKLHVDSQEVASVHFSEKIPSPITVASKVALKIVCPKDHRWSA